MCVLRLLDAATKVTKGERSATEAEKNLRRNQSNDETEMSRIANFCALAVAVVGVLVGSYVYIVNQATSPRAHDWPVPVARARKEPWFNYSGVVDLSGKLALVTGGSTGIGRAVAVELYKLGADVVITSRSEKRAVAAARSIEAEDASSAGSVRGMSLQLASNANVREFAAKFKAELLSERSLTYLVENAGMAVNLDFAPVSCERACCCRVPSLPQRCSALPCPALPCPALPCPALPCDEMGWATQSSHEVPTHSFRPR